ncbi:hypothetical protein [Acidithiobacillus thiooxidans]|jgi:hypothetical protein|uniref:hypothetical protein n=1 Tax=Acidithiobacillus thiooxidans TaxID=930 RepID=UPI00242F1A5C|nr:hypothetical protein [Acidithiobacillus thiooxidans]
MNIYDLIDEWGLDKRSDAIRKFTRREVESFIERVENLYLDSPQPKIGSCNPGIQEVLSLFSTPKTGLQSLSSSILLAEKIWLPDPIFGAFAQSAAEVWLKMPDSGSRYLLNSPGAYTQWKPFVSVKVSERKDVLRQYLSSYLLKILSLRKLHENGAVGFYSWERLLAPRLDHMRNVIQELRGADLHKYVTTAYDQDQYSLGTRMGPIGIVAQSNCPETGLKAGAKLWIGDSTPILVYGLLNAAVSESLGCRFEPQLPGDRVIYDFAKSNGRIGVPTIPVEKPVILPSFNDAIFDDLAVIRNDSELLDVFRKLLTQLAHAETEVSLDAIRSEIKVIAARLHEDKPLRKAVGPASIDFSVALLGGIAGAAITGSSIGALKVAAASVLTASAATYIKQLAVAACGGDASKAKARNEVITRISRKL